MQVGKWGNSLALRLPQAVVEALGLKAGDEVEVTIAGERVLEVTSERRKRERALERLRSRGWKLPEGWKFDREEIYEEREERLMARLGKK
jgi:antitoxin MazE